MADASYQQTNFLGGEWSKSIQGRIDRPDYRGAMNYCFNGLPVETGMWVRRPGSRFAQTTRGGIYGRALAFDFADARPYSLIFTSGRLQFLSAGVLVTTNESVAITNVSSANPAVVQTASARSWITSELVYFSALGTTAPLLQNRVFVVTRIDATHFSLADSHTGAAIDGATLGWTSSPSARIDKVQEYVTPYLTQAQIDALRVVQSDTGAIMMDGNAPQQLVIVTEPAPTLYATFGIGNFNFQDGPYFDAVTSNFYNASTLTGAVAIATNTGVFAATDVGRSIRLYSEPPQWSSGAGYVAADVRAYAGQAYIRLTVGAGTTPPPYDPANWALTPNGTIWTWGIITTFTNASHVTVTLQGQDLLSTESHVYRLGVYSNTTGWPTCGTYVDDRLWLSGAVPNRFDASIVGNINVFSPTDVFGQVSDANAISGTFSATDINDILWMTQDQQGIICGTKGGEWLIHPATTAAGLTPSNTAARRVTKIGCANIEPVRTEHTIVFVQKYRRKVMEYFADVYSGKFTAPHITSTGKHLTAGGVTALAYQQELAPVVWALANQNLLGCTYRRNTLTTAQGPDIAGWHHHSFGSQRAIVSMAMGGALDGLLDALTLITVGADGSYHIEVMGSLLEEGSTTAQACYLDNSIIPTSSTAAAISTDLPFGGLILNGLWHLNGQTVTAMMGGIDCGDFLVTNGSITVPFGNGLDGGAATFTPEFMEANGGDLMPMFVGFSYASQGQTVRPATPQEAGTRTGPALGKLRRTHQLVVQLEGAVSNTISFGTSFATAKLIPAQFHQANGVLLQQTEQFTGVFRDAMTDSYSFDSMICWQVIRPYICNVVAIGGLLQSTDA